MVKFREFRTAVFSEDMDRLLTDGLILALMSSTFSLKKFRFRKPSHLETEASKHIDFMRPAHFVVCFWFRLVTYVAIVIYKKYKKKKKS